MNAIRLFLSVASLTLGSALALGTGATAEDAHTLYQPNAESQKFPEGSTQERRARMSVRAKTPAYTKKFDLNGLPHYVPQEKPTGELRVCGNNYIGDSPLAGWWKDAFERFQPGIKIVYNLPTAAIAFACLYLDQADIGIDHAPSFYDSLAHLRMKGYEPTGFPAFTGSYDVIGWQNNIVIVVNKANPLTKISMKQLDDIFGSQRDGAWVGTTWHPELARGADENIHTWGQLGLTGAWADKKIDLYGFSVAYATAGEFSEKALKGSDRWSGDLHDFGNYKTPEGKTYLETDQVIDHVAADPNGIGYLRFHDDVPKSVKLLAVSAGDSGPYVEYTIDNAQNRSYPLTGDQSLWVSQKPGTKLDPKIREFIRFVLSQEGQELVERDGKYLPLNAATVQESLKRLQ